MFLQIFLKAIDFIYPNKCLVCNQDLQNYGLCTKCFNDLEIQNKYCKKCGFENANLKNSICFQKCRKEYLFDSIDYCFEYNNGNTIAKILHKLKYEDDVKSLNFLVKYLTSNFIDINPDILVIPPLHYSKIFSRKYNHLALLARQLIKTNKSNAKFLPFSVKKNRNTKSQMLLNGKDRLTNLTGAFSLQNKYRELIKNKKVLILEDIVTTGSTIYELSKELHKGKPKEICVLSISKVKGMLRK